MGCLSTTDVPLIIVNYVLPEIKASEFHTIREELNAAIYEIVLFHILHVLYQQWIAFDPRQKIYSR